MREFVSSARACMFFFFFFFFLHCYLHRKFQLAFSIRDLVYDAVVFFLLFHRFSNKPDHRS